MQSNHHLFTTIAQFKAAYMGFMNNEEYWAISDKFKDSIYRLYVAEKMLLAVKEKKYNADWLSDNKAMRLAAKKFGMKTSPVFRNFIKSFTCEEIAPNLLASLKS